MQKRKRVYRKEEKRGKKKKTLYKINMKVKKYNRYY